MKKTTLTEKKAENTPNGGVLVGKRKGQTIIHDKGTMSGYLVGKTHAEGGIKAVNKSTGQPLEMQGGEVVITAPAVADQTKNEFNGEMLTNREILSKINEKGGGVSFANGGDVPKSIKHFGEKYNYGGKTMTDYEIIQEINSCGCEHSDSIIVKENKSKKNTFGNIKFDVKSKNKILGEIVIKPMKHSEKSKEIDYYEIVNSNIKEPNKGIGTKAYIELIKILDKPLHSDMVRTPQAERVWEKLEKMGLAKKSKDDLSYESVDYKELSNGGHLSKGKSLPQIAKMHDVSMEHIMKQVKMGLKAESEHTSSEREQMKIVKDHLVENPNYYTLLKKVGLEKGGLIAPNGKKSNLTTEQYKLVRTPEFKAWFGDWENDPENASKVVDENGEPLVVYHGTYSDKPFYTFDFNKADLGFHFGTYEQAKNRSETKLFFKGHKTIINSFFLNIRKIWNVTDIGEWEYPQRYLDEFISDKIITETDAKKLGFFNLIYKEDNKKIREYILDKFKEKVGFEYNNKYEGNGKSFIVLKKNQIKLADGTNTEFNINNDDIRFNNGGQVKEDLEKDAKSGNTPARDLNNYNDVLDLEADGVVGAENGLYANGGDIDFDVDGTGGADASAGVGAFEDGGKLYEYAEGGEVSNPIVSNWDNVNSSWKDTSKVKKIVWANNPYDKGLYNIVAPYLGKDELRPVMSGINFDENGITATNAHVLITLPYPNKKYEGIYEPDLSKRPDSDQITIDGRYPNYPAVIPHSENTTHFLIDVYKLLQYTNVAMKYANKTTYQVVYKINNESAGFNGRFMVENLKTLLRLGHEKVYANYIAPNKAMVLSPSKNYSVGSDEILLTMPVMVQDQRYGARDIDYGRELSVYFDFDDNEIHNADGSVANFKMKYEDNSPVDIDDVKLLESMVKKNKTLHILDYVSIKDNTLRATNLKADYVIKNVNLPDGIYLPTNGNLEITMNPLDDYPREPIFVLDENTIEFSIPSTVFEYYIDRFKFVLDQDDLRPIFKAISLKHTSDNKLFLLGTDSKLGLKIDITKYVNMPLYNREIQTVIDPVWLFGFLAKLEEGTLRIKSNNVATIIDSDSKSFYCRNVDGNYPNLEAVIPQTSDDLTSIEYSALKKCLNSEFMKNYKKQTDKNQIIGVFDKNGEVFVGRRYNNTGNSAFTDIEKLCDIKIQSSKEQYTYDGGSVLLAMPLIAGEQDNFAFDEKLLSKVMAIANDSELEMHHNGVKRAFIIPINSFEYEKTTIEHKTKEQKLSEADLKQIIELEELKDDLEKTLDSDELQEAIETLNLLMETAKGKNKKEIKEALEILEMLK